MSRRGFIILFIMCISVLIIGLGIAVYFIVSNNKNENYIAMQHIEDECTIEGELQELGLLEDGIYANASDEKISPNANLIIKKHYIECNHTTKEYIDIPKEIVNMTKIDLENEYEDFKIESFSSNEIVLFKEESGMCNEHYVLREKEGIVAIYRIEENGRETLIEETGISTEYLPESDLINFQNGIKIYGKEKLNATIEDYE